ncbi:hypothetical protein [Brotaphodocola sp.]|uniref:hypothetical protein n=1 Tax=Brotaphodocola sp. TaxID=3073577 RepID=UPI003D7DAFA5
MSKNKNKPEKIRLCVACGENHNGGTCPLILEKLNRYYNSSKQNFLMGNILLECIHKKVDFLQILLEIAEASVELDECINSKGFKTKNIYLDYVAEYFAASLECKSSLFFTSPQKTSEAFSKILKLEYLSDISLYLCNDEDKTVDRIEMNLKIPDYTDINTVTDLGLFGLTGYKYQITKHFLGNDFYNYSFEICLPISISFETREHFHNIISWGNLTQSSSTSILLLEEENGSLADLFEKEMNLAWDEDHLILSYPYEDPRFNEWLTILEISAKNDSIVWHKTPNNYYCAYGKTAIQIKPNISEAKVSRYNLYIRRNKDIGICFNYIDQPTKQIQSNIKRLENLVRYIEKYVKTHPQDKTKMTSAAIEHEIGMKDFVVRQAVFKCRHDNHTLIDIEAVVNIMPFKGQKKKVKIPAGYCPDCKIYFILESTYQELKSQGYILCRVSDEKTYKKSDYFNNAKLAQESILMQYGYNVSQTDDISEEKRRSILAILLDNNLLSKTEIIGYLDFFINQRIRQTNMKNAISKWKADRAFVNGYHIGEYTQFGVHAIFRR